MLRYTYITCLDLFHIYCKANGIFPPNKLTPRRTDTSKHIKRSYFDVTFIRSEGRYTKQGDVAARWELYLRTCKDAITEFYSDWRISLSIQAKSRLNLKIVYNNLLPNPYSILIHSTLDNLRCIGRSQYSTDTSKNLTLLSLSLWYVLSLRL